MTDFKMIPLKDIHPDPNQPRKIYDETSMQELTQSIHEKGVLQPILLRPNGKGYILVCGERRYRGATAAGLAEIPAVIRELSDEEALELQIIENLQRKDVHPMEEAIAFKSLIDKKKWSLQEIASRVGKKDSYVRQRLKLIDLTAPWQKLFYRNVFTLHEALSLSMLPEKAQNEFYKNEIDKDDEVAVKIEINSYRLDQYKGDLHKAIFALDDITLDKKMGACTSCQFNTSTLKLFSDNNDSVRCMNVSCFKHKTDIYFDRELKKALEDPEVILVNQASGETGAVQKLKKEGHAVLRDYYDFSTIHTPEKPDWEEFKEYNGDGETPDHELRKDFEKELKQYEKELAEYQKKVSTGRYKKAFVVDAWQDKGKYIFIELKKSKAQASAKQAVENGDASIADIDEEINRIRDREKRNKELDGEKVYASVKDILQKSKEFTKANRNHELIQEEVSAACIALFEGGSYDFKKWMSKKLGLNENYILKPQHYLKINLTYLGMNELLWHFILDKLVGNGGSPATDAKALAIYNIAKHYHATEVSAAEIAQQEVADRRAVRTQKRIAELQAKKKELQAAAKSTPTKKAKTKN